jgi:hypothetical protein
LRGKIFGVQSIGGTVWMGAILALEHFGLDPTRDKISLIAAGDQSVLAQALLAGTIDVTVLDGVMSRTLRENGYPILAELSKHSHLEPRDRRQRQFHRKESSNDRESFKGAVGK